MEFVKCRSCNTYCNEDEIGTSEASDSDVCPNCGMICPNCNKYIQSRDYLKATNKCIDCDDFF